MKKNLQYFLLLFVLFGLGFLASCGDDDEVDPLGPTIDFQQGPDLISSDTTIRADTTIRIGINADKGDFDMQIFTISVDDILIVDIEELSGDSTSSFSGTQDITIPDIAGEFVIEATVVDSEGNSSSVELTLEVKKADVQINMVRMLMAPDGNNESETFYSTNLDELYSINGVLNTPLPVSGEIDFGYAYGQTDGAILASPGDYPNFVGGGTYKDIIDNEWAEQNLTEFRTTNLSVEAFDAITEIDGDMIVDEYEAGTDVGNSIDGIQVDDVIAFKTKTNQSGRERFGLLKVIDINPTANPDGFIEIQVKVEL